MELSKETFARIIKATASGVDWEQFGIRIATQDPELFVQTLDELSDWKGEARAMFGQGENKVAIVRYIKNESGMSLGEAKDWYETHISAAEAEE